MMTHAGAAAVAGIGVDLLRLDRIERVFARHGERFVRRILGPQEIEKFNSRYRRDPQRGLRFLATRFAAKEAFSKAIGLGLHSPMAWSRMQTLNEPSGRPSGHLSAPLARRYRERLTRTHVVGGRGEGRSGA